MLITLNKGFIDKPLLNLKQSIDLAISLKPTTHHDGDKNVITPLRSVQDFQVFTPVPLSDETHWAHVMWASPSAQLPKTGAHTRR